MGEKINNLIYIILSGTVAVLAWVVVALILFYVPVQGEILADMGAPLSTGMQLALDASDILRRNALIMFPLFFVITGLPFYIWLSGNE